MPLGFLIRIIQNGTYAIIGYFQCYNVYRIKNSLPLLVNIYPPSFLAPCRSIKRNGPADSFEIILVTVDAGIPVN